MFLVTIFFIYLFQLTFGIELFSNINEINRSKRAIITKRKFNFTSPIPYHIAFENPVKHIRKSLEYLSEQTCLEFNKKKKPFKTMGLIFESSDCNEIFDGSDTGKATVIQLDLQCLHSPGCVKHHIGLALGLIPHQIRWDRNSFIRIHKNNIKEDYQIKYKKFYGGNVRIFNTPFDYGSLMNYERNFGSLDGKFTHSSKIDDLYNKMLGQREDFTHNDIKLLNDFYCSNKCPKKIRGCINGGYPDPKDCNNCRCPPGFRTKLCGIPQKSTGECAPEKLHATREFKTLEIKTDKICNHLILSPRKTKVEVVVVQVKTKKREICTPKGALEIRHRHNKGAVGLSLCGSYKNLTLKPYFSQVFVRYEGSSNQNHFAILKYRAVN